MSSIEVEEEWNIPETPFDDNVQIMSSMMNTDGVEIILLMLFFVSLYNFICRLCISKMNKKKKV